MTENGLPPPVQFDQTNSAPKFSIKFVQLNIFRSISTDDGTLEPGESQNQQGFPSLGEHPVARGYHSTTTSPCGRYLYVHGGIR